MSRHHRYRSWSRQCLSEIIATPPDQVTEHALRCLTVGGRDQYSRMRAERLRDQVGAETAALIDAEVSDPGMRASAMRWVARGLSAHLAVRKVRLDAEGSTWDGPDYMDDDDDWESYGPSYGDARPGRTAPAVVQPSPVEPEPVVAQVEPEPVVAVQPPDVVPDDELADILADFGIAR